MNWIHRIRGYNVPSELVRSIQLIYLVSHRICYGVPGLTKERSSVCPTESSHHPIHVIKISGRLSLASSNKISRGNPSVSAGQLRQAEKQYLQKARAGAALAASFGESCRKTLTAFSRLLDLIESFEASVSAFLQVTEVQKGLERCVCRWKAARGYRVHLLYRSCWGGEGGCAPCDPALSSLEESAEGHSFFPTINPVYSLERFKRGFNAAHTLPSPFPRLPLYLTRQQHP